MSDPMIHVYILDDDPLICNALSRLVRSAKMQPRAFTSVEDFMRSEILDENACIVSDVRFPGTSGLDLPLLLAQAGHQLPVIFLTGDDTSETRNRAKRLGASAYFRKPMDDQALLDAIVWII
jgi:FixJ family two-component response regulator